MALQTGNVHTYSQNTWSWSDVVAGPDGAFYLAYKNDSTSISIVKWNGNTWADYASFSIANTPTPDTSFSDDLDLAITPDGHLHIVFRHSNQVGVDFNSPRGVSYGDFDGSNWNFTVVDEASDPNGAKNYNDPSLVVDADGHAHIAYLYSASGLSTTYDVRYATNESGSWAISDVANWSGAGADSGINEFHIPSLTIGPDGKLTLTYLYEDGHNFEGNVYSMEKPDGGSWSSSAKIFDAWGIGSTPNYDLGAADAQGHPHLIYAKADGSLHDLTNASGSWQTTEILPAGTNASYATDYQVVNGTQYMLVTNNADETYFYYNSGNGWQQGNQAITGDSDLDFAVNSSGVGMVITLNNGVASLRDIDYATGDIGAPTNSAPTVTGLPASITVIEDANYDETQGTLNISSSSFADLDGDSITVTLSVSAGAINLANTTIPVTLAGFATSTVTISGAAAAVNQYLDIPTNMRYSPPANLSGANAATLTVSANDGSGIVTLGTVPINITATNDEPVITSNASISIDENRTVVATVTATDVDVGDTLTYSISGGTDAALFKIDPVSGQLSFLAAPNFEAPSDSDGDNNYGVQIKVSDGSLFDLQDITVTVTNVNEAPEITSDGSGATATIDVSENTQAVTTVTATDVENDTLTYTISGGVDAALFDIDSANGALSFKAAPDFEVPTDANGDNNYEVQVSASDGALVDTQAITVAVKDGNDAPTDISLTSAAVAENAPGAVIGVLGTTDPDQGDAHTYSVDDSRFEVLADGTLKLKDSVSLDYETEQSVTLKITSMDGGGLSVEKPYIVSVTDANDAPSVTGPTILAASNEDAAATLTTAQLIANATDVDAGDTLSVANLSVSAGVLVDNLNGTWTYTPAANDDTGVTFTYDVQDTHGSSVSTSATLDLLPVNDAPEITSNGSGTTAAISVAENTRAVTTVTASDVDVGDTLTYSINGTDAALFAIEADTGALSFITAPNFEAPADAGGDNVYDVTVRATDNGSSFDEQALAITVTDVYEAPPNAGPYFTGASELSIVENQSTIGALAATDPDGDALTYKITGGVDAALFKIDPKTGELSFITAPDFEAPGSAAGSNDYQVRVDTSDGSLYASRLFHVSVTDSDDENTDTDEKVGTDGNDVFHATDVAEHFLGGDGRDTVIFTGPHDDYAITVLPDGTVTVAYGNAVDTLESIERLQFDDGTLAFDTDGTAGQIFRLYQAAFGREPDAEGLGYWVHHQDTGQSSFQDVARSFMASPEFEQRYGSEDNLSNADFIDLLYQNVLGRDPDAAGFAYWTDKLDTGQTNFGDLLAFFSDSNENIAGTADAISQGMWFA